MAEIFRATVDPDPQAFSIAIKRLLPQLEHDPKYSSMFLAEAGVAKALLHPNLVQQYEAGLIDGHAYMALEYIWGFDLVRLMHALRRRRLRLPTDMAVYITLQVLRGLDYLHQAKYANGKPMDIVHHDVTPSNIYVTFRGEVKLGDFGVARVKTPVAGGQDTEAEAKSFRGKIHYMPPELLEGRPAEQQLDLWSLAASLYEMLAARPMFDGISAADLMAGPFPKIAPLHTLNPDVGQAVTNVLMRALDPRPRKRYPDAATFYRELKRAMARGNLHVDAASLSRFVRSSTGVVSPDPGTNPEGQFADPEYMAPLEYSPTQRYDLSRRRRRTLHPMMIVAPTMLLSAVLGVGYAVTSHGAATVSDADPPVPQATDASADGSVTGAAPESAATPATAPATKPAANTDDEVVVIVPPSTATEATPAASAAAPATVDETKLAAQMLGGLKDSEDRRFNTLLKSAVDQIQQAQYDQAIVSLRESLNVRPNSVPAQLGLARVLFEQGNLPEAQELVQKVLTNNAQSAPAYFLLGNILRTGGQTDAAAEAFQQSSRLDPDGEVGQSARQALSTQAAK